MLTEDQLRFRLDMVTKAHDSAYEQVLCLRDLLAELLPDLVAATSRYAEADRLYRRVIESPEWRKRMGIGEVYAEADAGKRYTSAEDMHAEMQDRSVVGGD